MRVLVVEDDAVLAPAIASCLTSAGMLPTIVGNGLQADQMIETAARFQRSYDAVVLDLTLPGMDGMDVLRAMRRRKDSTPTLVLTARSSLADRVNGLETGADDYLGKPFEKEELLARLRAITRRREEGAVPEMSLGNLSFNASLGTFSIDGALLVLPKRSHVIMELLFRRRGKPVSRDLLLNLDESDATVQSIDTQISRIRKKLEAAGANVVITTLRGTGYMLETEASQFSRDA